MVTPTYTMRLATHAHDLDADGHDIPQYVDDILAGDVTMTTAGTYYDGPSGSFVAGTWFLTGYLLLYTGGAQPVEFTSRLWDGSTIHGEMRTGTAYDFRQQHVISAIVTLGSTTTLKLSATSNTNAMTILADQAGTMATLTLSRLIGIRLG